MNSLCQTRGAEQDKVVVQLVAGDQKHDRRGCEQRDERLSLC